MPQRIQRKRMKGWRMPEGAIYVGRPSVWGNPFWHVQKFHGLEYSLRLYAQMARGFWTPSDVILWPDHYVSQIYEDHQAWLSRLDGHPLEKIRSELAGHDLACWCRLDQPCHADVLLAIANP
jgi:hypothetical protein